MLYLWSHSSISSTLGGAFLVPKAYCLLNVMIVMGLILMKTWLARGKHQQLPAYGVGRWGVGKGLSKLKISVNHFAIYNLCKVIVHFRSPKYLISIVSRAVQAQIQILSAFGRFDARDLGQLSSTINYSICTLLLHITTFLCPPSFSQCLFHSSILSWMSCYMSGQLLKWLSCHASV